MILAYEELRGCSRCVLETPLCGFNVLKSTKQKWHKLKGKKKLSGPLRCLAHFASCTQCPLYGAKTSMCLPCAKPAYSSPISIQLHPITTGRFSRAPADWTHREREELVCVTVQPRVRKVLVKREKRATIDYKRLPRKNAAKHKECISLARSKICAIYNLRIWSKTAKIVFSEKQTLCWIIENLFFLCRYLKLLLSLCFYIIVRSILLLLILVVFNLSDLWKTKWVKTSGCRATEVSDARQNNAGI